MDKPTSFKKTCQRIEVPTDDEVEALNAMKNLKQRVREIKKKISEISSNRKKEDRSGLSRLERDLLQLKTEWDQWEEKRNKAARDRMILLGHEEEEQNAEKH
jgi:hypothetical protein